MKILHTESSCGWGGQEIRILTESEGMIARGHDITIACPEHSNIFREAQKRGIKTIALPIEKKRISAFIAMKSFLKKNQFDVVNTHSSTDSWLVSLSIAWKKKRPGIVRTRHLSTQVHNNKATLWLYHKGNDFIVTTGEKLRQTLHKENKLPLDKMRSIPTGIDEQRFKKADDKALAKNTAGAPSNKTIIGILATIRTWKGHEYLLDAVARLERDDFHLLIIGDGPHRPALETKIDSLGISDLVSMVGNREDVVPWLQALDIFTLPSYGNEGVPQGIMQAMLCSLPIISTDVGSILEVVHHNKNGYIVESKDSVSLQNAISQLLDAPEEREKFGKNSLNHALKNCTMTTMIDEMEAIFKQVSH